MDLRTVIRILVRHWLIVGLVMVVTVGAGFMATKVVAPTYEARASMLFISPSSELDADGNVVQLNPIARSGSAEMVMATTLLTITQSEQWHERLKARGATGVIEYILPTEVIMDVRVEDSTAIGTMRTLSLAVSEARRELERRQTSIGAPENSLIAVNVLSRSTRATELYGSKIRAGMAVMLIGLAAAVTLAFAAEAFFPPRSGGRRRLIGRYRDLDDLDDDDDDDGPQHRSDDVVREIGRPVGGGSASRRDESTSEAVTAHRDVTHGGVRDARREVAREAERETDREVVGGTGRPGPAIVDPRRPATLGRPPVKGGPVKSSGAGTGAKGGPVKSTGAKGTAGRPSSRGLGGSGGARPGEPRNGEPRNGAPRNGASPVPERDGASDHDDRTETRGSEPGPSASSSAEAKAANRSRPRER